MYLVCPKRPQGKFAPLAGFVFKEEVFLGLRDICEM